MESRGGGNSSSELRVAFYCLPPSVYHETTGDGENATTTWRSYGAYALTEARRLGWAPPVLSTVHRMSAPAEAPLPGMQTLLEGRADVHPVSYGVTSERHRFVDFSFPIIFNGVHLFSSRRERAGGNIFGGVFDHASYSLYTLFIAAMAAVFFLWGAAARGKKRELPPLWLLLAFVGSAIAQPIPERIFRFASRRPALRLLLGLAVVINSLVVSMYGSVIIAKLTAKTEVLRVDTLEDLLRPEASHLDLFVARGTFVEDIVSKLAIYPRIEHRIKYVNPRPSKEEITFMIKKVLEGSAVVLEGRENFAYLLLSLTLDGNGACEFPLSSFRRSPAALFQTSGAWIYRKNMGWAEKLDMAIMWMDAFKVFFRNPSGEGLCSQQPMDEPCPKTNELNGNSFEDQQCHSREDDGKVTPLSITHLRRAFMVFAVGMSSAGLAFLFEILGAFKESPRASTKIRPSKFMMK